MSICSGIGLPAPRSLYRSVQYMRSCSRDADLLEMHRRMLVIRGFEERVAALYRDGEVPGFVHLSIGQEASAVGACWPLGPADVITSTHRGHGHCLAKGLDPLGMFAELMGKDAGTNRGRGGSMHIADPGDRHLRRQRDRGCRPADRGGRGDRGTTATRRHRRGRVLRRRRGRARHLPRSDQPRRGLAAAGDLLLREQRLRRVLARLGPARGATRAARRRLRRRLRRGRRQRRRGDRRRDELGDRRGRAPGAVPSSSRPRPTAGTVTTKATRSATGRPTRSGSGKRATRCSSTRAGSDRRASATTRSNRCSRRSRTSSTTPSRPRGSSTAPAAATLTDFVVRARPERPDRRTGRRRPGVPHHGRDPRRARSRARRRRARVRRRNRRRRRAATCSA